MTTVLRSGARIGSYALEGVLGRGATAVVYRATRDGRPGPVALKLLAAEAGGDGDSRARFEREVQLAAAVAHRGILPVHEAGEHDGRLFIAMQLQPRDLRTLLRDEGRLSPGRGAALVSQVAAALDAAHAHGLVHRDVKPSNILLGEEEGEERTYVGDFGVARAAFTDGRRAPHGIVGTVAYVSPEQIRGEPVDRRSDVYALGCVLFECLTGRTPYARGDSLATLWAHLHDEPPAATLLAPGLPHSLDGVVRRALAKRPEERFGSAGELAETVRAALEPRSPRPRTAKRGSAAATIPTTPASSFLGREEELSAAKALLQETRLLTVTGPGGGGKTRFALELARHARGSAAYDGGVFVCFLASLRDPALVLATIAQALSALEPPGKSALEAVSARIGDGRVLLLLDNVEHLPSAAAELEQLLAGCPSLTLLVTSRERLRLEDETAYDLPPLAAAESVALFCERAACEPSEPVAELCARLEGLPLAIELAAARTSLLSPEELLTRLSERLDLLRAGRDAEPRQQTLRATIAWSHALLAPAEQALFARLSVFAGGCTLDAAEAVCDADLDSLESLLDKSLLRRSGDRYWMLETTREYAMEALERLGEAEASARRHAEHFAELVEQHGPDVRGRNPAILDELAEDYANFRTALGWARAHGNATVLARIAGALGMYWNARGPYGEARAWLESAHDASRDDRLGALVARGLGAVCAQQGDFERSSSAYERGVVLARRAGDADLECACLGNLAVAAIRLADPARARELLIEARALAAAIGDDLKLGRMANTLGILALEEGRLPEAESAFKECLAAAEREGELESIAIARGNLGVVALREGRIDEAARYLRAAIRMADELQFPNLLASCVTALAAVEARNGHGITAARLLGIAAAILEEAGVELDLVQRRTDEEVRAAIREQLDEEAAAASFAAGHALERSEAVAYALE